MLDYAHHLSEVINEIETIGDQETKVDNTMAQELPCVVQECPYKTPKLEFDNGTAMLQLYINTVHPAVQPQPLTTPPFGHHPQAEHVKRPVLSFSGQTL